MIKRLLKKEGGQSMVEFALVLPLLLLLVCGILDFGWLYYNQIALNNAAREGARYAAIHYDPSVNWRGQAEDIMIDNVVDATHAEAKVSDPAGQKITATVTSDTPLLTGFLSTILGKQTICLKASCVMRLEC